MSPAFHDVAEVALGPGARVYEHGWQSWSPSGLYPADATSARPSTPFWRAMCYRADRPAPERGFQGEGLLALETGEGRVHVWSAPDPTSEVASIRAVTDGGRLLVAADGPVNERVYTGSVWRALARWAEELAARLGVAAPPSLPPVWCTWYQYKTEAREEDVVENLDAIDQLGLDVGVVQVDDGWQAELGDWLERSSRFPRPLSELAGRIRATGRRAGVWTAPLMVGARSRVAREHPEWLVGGTALEQHWGQPLGALDVTAPAAAEHLENVFRTLAGWSFDYFKLDFLFAGAAAGRRHDPEVSPIAAYREALRIIRRAVGPRAILLGCGAPLLPSIGLVDAMRVSPDIGRRHRAPEGDLARPSQESAAAAGRARAFQHARWWVNDPDCLIARAEMEHREEWAAHVERWGGLRGSSDRLLGLDEWGLATTRRLLRASSVRPLPEPDDPIPER